MTIYIINAASATVPIRSFLNGRRFDPDTIRAMGIAFEIVREANRISCRGVTDEWIAEKIIALARQGVRDAESLGEQVLADLDRPPASVSR